jgi:hypothetical protein
VGLFAHFEEFGDETGLGGVFLDLKLLFDIFLDDFNLSVIRHRLRQISRTMNDQKRTNVESEPIPPSLITDCPLRIQVVIVIDDGVIGR